MKQLLTIAAILSLTGCATIFTGSRHPLTINTVPDAASVKITDIDRKEVFTGTTPTTVKLRKSAGYFQRQEYTVLLQKDGYQDKTIPVNFKLGGWYFGNIVIGGAIGMVAVDPATGGMWHSRTKVINDTLKVEKP